MPGGPAASRAGSALVPCDAGWWDAGWWDADAEAGVPPRVPREKAMSQTARPATLVL